MTFPAALSIVASVALLAIAYMCYRLAEFALRTKGDVRVEMMRGKTAFKLQAKERICGK